MFCFSSFAAARDPLADDEGVAARERDLALLLLLLVAVLDGANMSDLSPFPCSFADEVSSPSSSSSSGSRSSLLLLLLLRRFSAVLAAILDCHDGGRGSDGLRVDAAVTPRR
jgi:hypothetical protein